MHSPLELEIDKRLQVGRDELVDDEDDEGANQHHHRGRHLGKPDAVAPLETIG